MNMAIVLGGTAVTLPRWNAAVATRLIERHRVTAWTPRPRWCWTCFPAEEAQRRDLVHVAMLWVAPRCPKRFPRC